MKQLSDAPARAMKVKLYAVIFVTLIAFTLYIGYNLFQTAVINSEYYRAKANNQQLDVFEINANRGTVYDKNGKVLAISSTVWTVILSPGDISDNGDDAKEICSMLSNILDVDYDKLIKLCEDTNNRYETVKKKIDKETYEKINEFKAEKGIGYYSVYCIEDTERTYPNGSLASNIVGFTNYDNEGAYGIEAYYDEYLQGRNGKLVKLKDGAGRTMTSEYEERYDAVDGNDVYMTVDSVLQHYLEKNLETIITQHNVANRATGIMMDPNTGAILAMATTSGYDLNNPSELSDADNLTLENTRKYLIDGALTDNGVSDESSLPSEILEMIENEVSQTESVLRETQWKNKAISELYFPGSVFKVITCAAALEENKVDYHSTFFCSGHVTVADTDISCWNRGGHGTLDLIGAVTKSCNPSFIDISNRLGAQKFSDYFEAFGFTQKTGIDLYGEAGSLYVTRDKMGPVELATSSFGQTNKITPLQMITAYAACVNGGYLVTPHVVEKVVDNDGNVIKTNETQVKRQVLSQETSEQMKHILEQVVESNGGSNSYISGYRIGGKSGTSQKIDDYSDEEMRYVASFCAFAPADDPQVIMLVIVDEPNPGGEPYYGSTVAAPVVSAVLKESFSHLEIYPQYTAEEQAAMDTVVPNIVGGAPLSATTSLNTKGLDAKFIGEGTEVIKTVPEAGQSIAKGGTVVIYLDDRDDVKVQVPDVIGKTVSEANRLITDAGLNIRLSGGAVDNENSTADTMSIDAYQFVNAGTVIEVAFTVDEGFGG